MNRFDNEIKRKLSDFQAEPPQEIWAAIENRLDKKEKANLFFWRKFAAAAAILILFATSSVLFIFPLFRSSQNMADNTLPTTSNDVYSPETSENSISEIAATSKSDDNRSTSDKTQLSVSDNNASPKIIASAQPDLVTSISENRNNYTSTDIPDLLPLLTSYVNTKSLKEIPQIFAYNIYLPATRFDETDFADLKTDRPSFAMAASPGFAISGYFAPQHSYRFQYGAGATGFTETLESEIMSFATGVQVNYKFNKRWEIQSGIGYNRIGQRVNDIASFSHPSMMPLYSSDGNTIRRHPQSMSTSMGGIIFTDQSLYFADVSSTRIITLKGSYDESIVNLLNKSGTGLIQHFEYLELPLSARYMLFERGLAVYAKAGVIANYLMSGDVYLLDNMPSDAPIGRSVGVSSFNFAGMGGLAFTYPLTNRMQLNVEPTATMFLRPMGQVQHLTKETYPYSWSVYMGISYKL